MNSNERKATSKEIIDRYIGALEDDLQHYTMVDKDSVKAKLIQFELKEYKQIKQDLDRLEQLEKENQELKEKNKKWQNLFGCDLCDALGREILLEENTKLKKALDIFERKHIHIYYLKRTKNVEEYNKMMDKFDEYDFFDYLIEEEYELLKEVLGCE